MQTKYTIIRLCFLIIFLQSFVLKAAMPPLDDFGAGNINSPANAAIAGSSVPITVVIGNYGTASQTFATIVTTVNGVIVNTTPWSGFLPGGSLTLVTLPNIIVPNSNFTLCIYTELPNDADHSNDTACANIFSIKQFNLPFADDFEGAVNWYAIDYLGSNTIWQHGQPDYGLTNSTHSGQYSWDVDLDTGYNSNTLTYLYSPYFSFTGAIKPKLSFWQNYNTELFSDGVTLQYTTNNGVFWNTLGLSIDTNSVNWYNTANLNVNGYPAWSGNSNGWKQSTYNLNNVPALANQPKVQFRFIFASGQTIQLDGHSIDDFKITIADSNDVGISAFILPAPFAVAGSSNNVMVQLENFGILPQTSIDIYYQYASNSPVGPYHWTGTLNAGQKTNVFLPTPFLAALGYGNLCAWTSLAGDTTSSNDSMCMVEIGKPVFQLNPSGFADDFENANINGWTNSSINPNTSWQLGTPNWHDITSAYSPVNAWMTNINSGYADSADCSLVSPFFDFSQSDSIVLSFFQKINAENSADGTRLEYSTDYGTTWHVLGAQGDVNAFNWYNNNSLISSILPAWSGSSADNIIFPNTNNINGWMKSSYNLIAIPVLNYQVNPVLFRFVFTSDNSVNAANSNYSGQAIDDFKLHNPCSHDIAIVSINNQLSAIAGSTFIPQVVIQNIGNYPASNINITYCITPNSTGIPNCINYTWSGTLTIGGAALIYLPSIVVPLGQSDFFIYVNYLNDCNPDNDSICANLIGMPIINLANTNYLNSFDSPNQEWSSTDITGTSLTNWELGTPNYGLTTGAHSPPNAWDINLNVPYSNSAFCMLYSPYFDLTNTSHDTLSFWHNFNSEQNWDGIRLEYSLNNSGNWIVLGTINDPTAVNWYNSTLNSSNLEGWSGNSGGWIHSKIALPSFFTSIPFVQFRFVFTSDPGVVKDGYSIDDFSIYKQLASDAGITGVVLPTNPVIAGQSINFNAKVKNLGVNNTNAINIYYSLNGGAYSNASWSNVITYGTTATITLGPINPVPGNNNLRVYITMPGDMDQSNDTLDYSFFALLYATVPYAEGFETTNSGWQAIPSTTGSTNWEWGSPSFGTTNSVHNGSNCWDVNLSTPYGNNVNTRLLSPVFNYAFLNPSELRCWVNYNTEFGGDGTRLMYSFDGINFQTLGIFNDPNGINWYNNASVAAFNGAGWSGNSLGWKEVVYNTSSFYGHNFVQYRFDFKSDISLSGDGFSIDDFVVNGTVGVQEHDGSTILAVYPNPVNDKLYIIFNRPVNETVTTKLLDLSCAVIFTQESKMMQNKYDVDLNNLKAGIYILQITAGENIYYSKISKIK